MKFKILDTTDDKYEGEIFEANGIAQPGDTVVHKDTAFKVTEVKWDGKIVTLICPNYQVTAELIEV